MPPTYEVHVFHINVPLGDSAIYLLVDVGSKPFFVDAAVLLDGGQVSAVDSIVRTINTINTNGVYIFDRAKPPVVKHLCFDSLVITHWDRDHCNGLVMLLEKDFAEQKEKGITTLKSPLLFYDTNDEPQSTLYAPYWNKSESALFFGPRKGQEKEELSSHSSKCKRVMQGKSASLQMKGAAKTKKLGGYQADKIAKINTGARNILGVDFFKLLENPRGIIDSKNFVQVRSPAKLIELHGPASRPGLYCIAADGLILGQNDLVDLKPPLAAITFTPITRTNGSSIVTMVIWPEPALAPKILHYSPGDAPSGIERAVVQWANPLAKVLAAIPMASKVKVPVVKLAHHGSAFSTPRHVIEGFEPEYVVISAGVSNTYRHPSWEILVYLEAYYNVRSKGKPITIDTVPKTPPVDPQPQLMKKPFLALTYPNYFKTEVTTKKPVIPKDFQINAIDVDIKDTDSTYGEFRTAVKLLRVASADFIGHAEQKQKHFSKDENKEAKLQKWVLEHLFASWSKLSDVKYVQAGTNADPTMRILYHLVKMDDNTRVVDTESAIWNDSFSTPPERKFTTERKAKVRKPDPDPVDPNKRRRVQTPILTYSELGQPEDKMDLSDFAAEKRPTVDLTVPLPSPQQPTLWLLSSYYEDHQLEPGSPFDLFVYSLNNGALLLKTALTEQSATVLLDDADEVMQWLADCGLGINTVALTGVSTSINALRVDLTLSFGKTSCNMRFSSDANLKMFGSVTGLGPPGITSGGGHAVIALSSLIVSQQEHDVGSQHFSLLDLPVQFPKLPGLANDIPLKLDDNKARNALYFCTWNYRTVLRLQFVPVNPIGFANNALLKAVLKELEFHDLRVITRQSSVYTDLDEIIGVETTAQVIISVTLPVISGEAVVQFNQGTTIVMIICEVEIVDVLGQGLEWLFKQIEGVDEAVIAEVKALLGIVRDTQIFKDFYLKRVTLTFSDSEHPKVLSFKIDTELLLDYGSSTAALLMSYCYPAQQFVGTLWIPLAPTSNPLRSIFHPDFEDFHFLDPKPNIQATHTSLSITNVLPQQSETPSSPPIGITPALATVTVVIDQIGITFAADLECVVPENSTGIVFHDASLTAQRLFSDGSTSLQLDVSFDLCPRPDPNAPPGPAPGSLEALINADQPASGPPGSAEVLAAIEYLDKAWTMRAGIFQCKMEVLYSLFTDEDEGHSAMNFLEKITIDQLSMVYHYDPNGMGTTFEIDGVISIGKLELMLAFHRQADALWNFDAHLGSTGAATSLRDILKSICGDQVDGLLPPSIGNIMIQPLVDVKRVGQSGREADGGSFEIHVRKATEKSEHYLVFEATITLSDGFEISIVQLQKLDGAAKNTTQAKRLLRVSTAQFPTLTLPVVNSFDPPISELQYIWVHDPGVTADEISVINSTVFSKKPIPLPSVIVDPVLSTGSHFLLLDGDKIVLDYMFQRQPIPAPAPVPAAEREEDENTEAAPAPSAGSPTSTPFKKKVGPLSISNIGLHIQDDVLFILLDAEIEMGPISFTLLGCGLGLDLAHSNFSEFPNVKIVPKLNGLEVGWSQPPTVLSGLFERFVVDGKDTYVGAAALSMDPYTLTAVGSYQEEGNFKSLFVFAELDGPLVELEFAEIIGIKAGFGYNSHLSLPTLEEVHQFPFIKGIPTKEPNDVLQVLQTPSKDNKVWVTSKDHELWIAAGFTLTAFEVINISAIVVFNFNPYPTLDVVAIATAQMPEANPNLQSSSNAFLFVEFDIVGTVDFQHGTFVVSGELNPNSFILHPSCHLSGGFGLSYWFAASGHEGDWVFTIGGYHPAFLPPSHYPKPQRLAIDWSLDSCLNVHGEAYFAITPSCCMGGGKLLATFSSGPLYAHFNAWADFLINYSPFHFLGDVGVNVGVDFTMDLWICTLHISVDVGASLSLAGPPFGGVVHVDFYVFGFEIHFGEEPGPAKALSLTEFCALLLQQSGDMPSADKADAFVYALKKGAYPGKKQSDVWKVRAGGLAFRIHSRFALSSATCGTTIQSPNPIFSKPMHIITPIQSSMTVRVTKEGGEVGGFTLKPVMKNVPQALWGKYDPNTDPTDPSVNNAAIMGSNMSVSLMMGVEVAAPPAKQSPDEFGVFNIENAMQRSAFNIDQPAPKKLSTLTSQTNFIALQQSGVLEAWKTDSIIKPEAFVSEWETLLGWKDANLRGTRPAGVIKAFSDIYRDAPWVTAK